MRDPSGARLSPDPVGFHSEALGELVSSEQAIHHVSLDEANRRRRASPGQDGAQGPFRCRSPAAPGSAAWDGLGAKRLFGVYMVGLWEVAVRGRYCVGTVASLSTKKGGGLVSPHGVCPGGVGASRCGVIPSDRTADASSSLEPSGGTGGD